MKTKRILKCSRRNYCEFGFFWCSCKRKNNRGKQTLGRHLETHAKVVMKLFEAASWFCCILTPGCCCEWLLSLYL